MAYLDYENAMLERFRAKHRELLAAHADVRLYALVEPAELARHERYGHSRQCLTLLQRLPLYAGSGLDTLEATGPVMLSMPDLRHTGTLTYTNLSRSEPTAAGAFIALLNMARRNAAHVTWIWSPHDIDAVVEHLQTLLHARLGPNGEDAWFFFYLPSHLRVLHERLPEETRRHVFGPMHAWWTLDSCNRLIEMAGESAPVPPAWDVFPIPADVVTALQQAAMPQQVLAWLQRARLNLTTASEHNGQLAEIEPWVRQALSYRLSSLIDIGTFVAYGLQYKVDYDQHPQLQALLTNGLPQGHTLARTYQQLGTPVWDEVLQSIQQRLEKQATHQWHQELKKVGYVRTRVRLIDCTRDRVGDVRFDLIPANAEQAHRQFVGDPDHYHDETSEHSKQEFVFPVPGGRIELFWQTSGVFRHRREFVVAGELPTNEKSGVVEILFSWDGISITMVSDPPNN